jgi:hypothetical protein
MVDGRAFADPLATATESREFGTPHDDRAVYTGWPINREYVRGRRFLRTK